jgi:DNA-binding HxlR family transcriptional regulator
MGKAFDQYCPMAHALSLVGDRWSLLIVRELLKGPKRYTDLAAGLPGIGTNILAGRLRQLEEGGVLTRRKLPPPAASTVYELTEYGAGLDEVMYALARWGVRSLGPPGPDDELYPDWGVNALAAVYNADAARGLTETYVIRVGDDAFTVRLEEGHMRAEVGAAPAPDLDLETDMDAFFALVFGDLEAGEAIASGRLRARGEPDTLARCLTVFSHAPRPTRHTTAAVGGQT